MAEAGRKVGLADQLAALEAAEDAFRRGFKESAEFYAMYPTAVAGKVEALQAARRTLNWIAVHQETIRAAIDAAQREP